MAINTAAITLPEAKTITHTLKLSSEELFKYLRDDGARDVGALMRVGSLLRMLSKEAELTSSVKKWLEEIFIQANKEAAEITVQKDLMAEMMGMELPQANIPDSYRFEVEIAHPSVWKLIRLVEFLDAEMNEIEVMYLCDAVTDEQRSAARDQSVSIVRRVIQKIFDGTAGGKRDGGKFSPMKFIAALRTAKGVVKRKPAPKKTVKKVETEVAAETKPVEGETKQSSEG